MTQPAPYSQFEVANVLEPLSTSSSNPLLQDADSPIFYALDFFDYVIRTFVGPRLQKSAAAANIQGIQLAVAQKYPWAPDLEYQSNQFRFPLLAIYRKSSQYRWRRIGWEDDLCKFDLFYALPPLTAGQNEAVLPILRAVEMAIRKKTTQGFDPGYTPPGGFQGQQPWTVSLAGVEEIGFERGHQGTLPISGSNLKFPFLLMEGYFVERDMYVPGPKFAGGDITGSLVAPDLTSIPQFLQASTTQAPQVTSVNPGGGPVAGGTPVTITGGVFLANPAVLFGNMPAASVNQVNATTITCLSPAVSGAGTLGVTVVNRDGQSGSLANSYTYV